MDLKYTSLTLNGRHYSAEELIRVSENILNSWSAAGWQKKIHLFIQDWLSQSAHLEVTTSGSTGSPKSISVAKENMVKSALRTGDFLRLKPGDKALLCLPVDYIAGKMMVVRAFVLGLDLVTVHPSSDPLDGIGYSVDFAAMTPMQLHHALERGKGIDEIQRIEKLIIGGGAMDALLTRKVSALSTRVYHTYGMTETLTHVAMKKISGEDADRGYRALQGVSFEADERGCLLITDSILGLERMVTSDLVELLSAREFMYLGRIDHVINSGGIKVNPEIVEGKIQAWLGNRVVVAGKSDRLLGEKVVLIIELKNSGKPAELQSVIGKAALERFEKPREVYFVDFFPESSSGKVLRKKLLGRIDGLHGESLMETD